MGSTSYIGNQRYYYSAYYSGYYETNGNPYWMYSQVIETDDNEGKFRIKRLGNTLNTYYYDPDNQNCDQEGWVLLGTFEDSNNYIGSKPINMILNNYNNTDLYSTIIDMQADFKNFIIKQD